MPKNGKREDSYSDENESKNECTHGSCLHWLTAARMYLIPVAHLHHLCQTQQVPLDYSPCPVSDGTSACTVIT